MTRVFFAVTMSLDGFIAPEERADDPEGEMWLTQWMRLQDWVGRQEFFLENLQLGEGGETGEDNALLKKHLQPDRREHHGKAHVRRR